MTQEGVPVLDQADRVAGHIEGQLHTIVGSVRRVRSIVGHIEWRPYASTLFSGQVLHIFIPQEKISNVVICHNLPFQTT